MCSRPGTFGGFTLRAKSFPSRTLTLGSTYIISKQAGHALFAHTDWSYLRRDLKVAVRDRGIVFQEGFPPPYPSGKRVEQTRPNQQTIFCFIGIVAIEGIVSAEREISSAATFNLHRSFRLHLVTEPAHSLLPGCSGRPSRSYRHAHQNGGLRHPWWSRWPQG